MFVKESLDIVSAASTVLGKIAEHAAPKAFVALLTTLFLPNLVGIIVLFLLIGIDTALGSWYAIQSGSFSSAGMKKTLIKLILYTASILSIKLIDLLVGSTIGFMVTGLFV